MKDQAIDPKLGVESLHKGVPDELVQLNQSMAVTGLLEPIEHDFASAFWPIGEDGFILDNHAMSLSNK